MAAKTIRGRATSTSNDVGLPVWCFLRPISCAKGEANGELRRQQRSTTDFRRSVTSSEIFVLSDQTWVGVAWQWCCLVFFVSRPQHPRGISRYRVTTNSNYCIICRDFKDANFCGLVEHVHGENGDGDASILISCGWGAWYGNFGVHWELWA